MGDPMAEMEAMEEIFGSMQAALLPV